MQTELFLNGPLKLDSVFNHLSNALKCKIYPNSTGGNKLQSKYHDKLNKILLKKSKVNKDILNNFNISKLEGNFFLIFLKQFFDAYSKSEYTLSIVKVSLKFDDSENFYTIIPLECHSISSESIDEVLNKYENFKIDPQNGFRDNFFGKVIMDSDSAEGSHLIESLTFNNDFNSLIYSDNDLEDFFHNIWPQTLLVSKFDYFLSDLDSFYKINNRFFLPNVCLELSGNVHKYLMSDLMFMPDKLKCTKFSNVDDVSDFSDYPDSEDTERTFDFDSEEFSNFFSQVTESIKDLGGSVLPYINNSYLQDGSWITNNSTICNDLRDLILLLKSSTKWQSKSKPNLKLFLFKAINFHQSSHFRVFLFYREVVIISQLFLNQVYDSIIRENKSSKLVRRILSFCKHKLIPLLPEGLSNFVIDLYILNRTDEIYLTNLSSWKTKELIFGLDEIYEFATSGKPFVHDDSVKVHYCGNIALIALTSNKLSRHKLYSFCPEDVKELSKIVNS